MSIKYTEMVVGVTLTAAPLVYYATAAFVQASIQAVSITNPTGAAVTVNLYKVPNAGAAGNANKIASRVVPANSTVSLPDAVNHKLAPGSQLFADGLACTLNISGVEFIPGT